MCAFRRVFTEINGCGQTKGQGNDDSHEGSHQGGVDQGPDAEFSDLGIPF